MTLEQELRDQGATDWVDPPRTMDEANDFLMSSGGATSAKFENINDGVKGTIENAEVRAQTDIKTGEPLFWNDGNPRKQLVITIATDLHESDEDDGRRRVFAKGQMLAELRDAVKGAGATGVEEGGFFAVQYVKDGEQTQRGFNPPKHYKVWYKRPERQVMVDDDATPF